MRTIKQMRIRPLGKGMNNVNAITNRTILVAAAAVQASGTFLKDSYGMSIELFPVASTRMCLLDDLSCSSFRSSESKRAIQCSRRKILHVTHNKNTYLLIKRSLLVRCILFVAFLTFLPLSAAAQCAERGQTQRIFPCPQCPL
jgi:hypothetical protein